MNAETAVQRVAPLNTTPWETRDPFLFCVYHLDAYPIGNEQMGPQASLSGRMMGRDFANKDGWNMYHGDVVPGFPQHPHRGFETITVVRRGLVDHSDSMGATARYGEGDVQWLTAGGGIQHAEMFPLTKTDRDNPLELFQIWINLPKKDKMVEPYFTMFWSNEVPTRTKKDKNGRSTHVAVIAGSYDGANPPAPPPNSWASDPKSDVALWTIKMDPHAEWTLPAAQAGTARTLYVFAGNGFKIGTREIPVKHLVELHPDTDVILTGGDETIELLLMQGQPIDEPVVHYGPFVMNTREEINQAMMDYRRTQFGGWPWSAADPVHERRRGRFARHANGKEEEPA